MKKTLSILLLLSVTSACNSADPVEPQPGSDQQVLKEEVKFKEINLGQTSLEPAENMELSYEGETTKAQVIATREFVFAPDSDGKLRIDMDIMSFKGGLCLAGWDSKFELFKNHDADKVGELKTFGGLGIGKSTLPLIAGETYMLRVSVKFDAECEKNAGFTLRFKPRILPAG